MLNKNFGRSKALLIFIFSVYYFGASLVTFYKINWLSGFSIFKMVLVGPPMLLVWGENILPLYWLVTVSIFGLMIGVIHSDFKNFSICMIIPVWLGAGFFSAAMSV